MQRFLYSRMLLSSCVLIAVSTLGACVNALVSAKAGARPGEWTALQCRSCERDRIAVDVRPSVTTAGRTGTHLLARIRNLNSHRVVLLADFRADRPPEDDGYVSGEELRVVLGAKGKPDAEVIVLLKHSTVTMVSIGRLERVAASSEVMVAPTPR